MCDPIGENIDGSDLQGLMNSRIYYTYLTRRIQVSGPLSKTTLWVDPE